jgi:NTE family protein
MARPKLGLALSGGGFRASLFHIGVLARLAELDRLKDIEVISTVSGGSILGAYYYLKIKQLLEGRRADFPQPCRDAYLKIVEEIETDFLAVVQKNLRMRALWNPYKNARMFLSDDYSRSDRMSELYNEYLYLPVWREIHGGSQDRGPLSGMKITPPDQKVGFDLPAYNAGAAYKIPNLVINATSLNTGHSWHFTSSWVGEPRPKSVTAHTLDTNWTLEQLRFDGKSRAQPDQLRPPLNNAKNEALRNAKLAELTLADAVAASACVPGLFTPMPIHDLYWSGEGREIVVELVDGGVFDNQGIDALYVESCSEIICSDASGQLEDECAPSSKAFAVAMRANGVMMDRIRNDGYYNLFQSERGDKLIEEHDPACAGNPLESELRKEWNVDKFAFFHLRECFARQPDYPAFPGPVDKATANEGHIYRLSNIRTDLDSFSDVEAFSLMYDGYCLSNERLFADGIGSDGTLPSRSAGTDRWQFLQITELLEPARLRELLKHLRVGSQQFFKVFGLGNPWAIALALVMACAVAWLGWHFRHHSLAIPSMRLTVGGAAGALTAAGLVWLLKKLESTRWMGKLLEKTRWLRRGQWLAPLFAALAILLLIVSAVVTIHLLVFDRLFLRSGRIPSRP